MSVTEWMPWSSHGMTTTSVRHPSRPRRPTVNNAGHVSRRRRSPRFLRLAGRADGGAAACAGRQRRSSGSTPATRVLGFGFATPYLGAIAGAERVLAFMPAGQGVIDWPRRRPARRRRWWRRIRCRSPIPRIDLVILVHALEMSTRPNALMAELRRVLTGGGRLIVVVPNRQGPWASTDLSPFGFGRPYSRGQLRQPLRRGRVRGGDLDDGAAHAAGGVAAAARRRARARPHRPLVWPAFAGVIVVVGGEAHACRA